MIKLKNLLRYNYIFIILFALVLFNFILRIIINNNRNCYRNEKIVSGKILSYSIKDNKLKLLFKDKDKIISNYYFKDNETNQNILNNICLGCTINMAGNFEEIKNNTIPNNFNYKKYLENKNIFYSFKIDKFKVKKDNNFIYKIKDKIFKRIYKMKYSNFLLMFITGDKSLLDKNEYLLFKDNGIAHLFAVSGMHVGIIISFFNKFLSFLKLKYKNVIIIFILLLFGFIIGFSASFNRVLIFYVLSLINKKYKLNYSSIKILIFTICIELLINPFLIYDIGFLYSHIITFGLIFNKDFITGKFIVRLLKISYLCFLYSLPITILINYEINPMSILNNIIFVPFVCYIIYPLSLITFIFPNAIYGKVINFLVMFNRLVYKYNLIINMPKMNIVLIMIYYLILLGYKKNHKLISLLFLILIFNKLICFLNQDYYLYFFDVGQGDSSLLVYPHKKEVIMVDTGGKVSFNKKNNVNHYISNSIILFLKSIGITKLNYLIITHGDYDHIGEAINLVDNFKVENVIFNVGEYNKLEKDLIKVLKEKRIPYYQNIESLNINNNKLYFLNTRVYDNENDNSSVIYTKINNKKILLMGDAGKDKELDIINKFNIKDIDILKVGHHGSDTSSSNEFINTIKPKTCIISVGKNNHFGHPKESVINTLDEYCDIYRTDINGSISLKYAKKSH